MNIFVKVNDTGAMLPIQLQKEDTVFDIIERIQQTSEDLEYDFGLFFQRDPMEEHLLATSYGLGEESTIHLIRRSPNVAVDVPMCSFCNERRATVHCRDCAATKILCFSCNKVAHKNASKKDHQRGPLTKAAAPLFCTEIGHEKQECVLYCRHEKVPICLLCPHEKHKGPDPASIVSEASLLKQALADHLNQLAIQCDPIRATISQIDNDHKLLTGTSLLRTTKLSTAAEAHAASGGN